MPPSHLTLPNNQVFPKAQVKRSVIAEASGYPNAPSSTCSADFQVGFSGVVFTHVHCFRYQVMTRWIVFIPSLNASLLIYVTSAPRALIAKTKSNQSQRWEETLLKVLISCLMSRYWWEDRCWRLKTSTFKPCHIICQLGWGVDSVEGVKAVFWEPNF